jgi:hypothetical protein
MAGAPFFHFRDIRGRNKIYKRWSKWKGTAADRAKPTTRLICLKYYSPCCIYLSL